MISGESLCVACVPTKISNLFSLGYFRWFPARCTKKKLGKSCGADCGQNVYRICPLVYGKAQLEKGKIKRKTTYGICM